MLYSVAAILLNLLSKKRQIIEYVYDGNGNRFKKSVITRSPQGNVVISDTFYHYDKDGNIVSETDKDNNLKVRYVRDTSGKAISMLQYPEPGAPNPVPTTYYFVYNGHGDVTALTNASGAVVATYSYDEFGNSTTDDRQPTTDIYNPIRYSGAHNAYYDSETSLYKMGTRYYQSDIGRWLTRDSYKGNKDEPISQNRYLYVNNNPINNIDPTGFWADTAHRNWTRGLARRLKFKYRETLAQGNYDMDSLKWWAGPHPEWHFDWEGDIWRPAFAGNGDTRLNFFSDQYQKAKGLAKQNPMKASYELGRGLHSLQDIYSHGYIAPAEHKSKLYPYGRYPVDDLNWKCPSNWPGHPNRRKATHIATLNMIKLFMKEVGSYIK